MPVSTSPKPGSSALAVAGSCSCISDSTCNRRTSSDAGGIGSFRLSGTAKTYIMDFIIVPTIHVQKGYSPT